MIVTSTSKLKAIVVHHELPLLRIAQAVGSTQKPKWEEALLLKDEQLRLFFPDAASQQQVFLFHFGSIVFIEFSPEEIRLFIASLQAHGIPVSTDLANRFQENYRIERNASALAVTNAAVHLMEASSLHEEIVATVLAKSIAFEAIEHQVEALLDEMEATIEQLKRGKLSSSDTALSRLFGNILGYKLNTVSSLMLLDEPDITWENEQAATLFSRLYQLFELASRYDIIRHKSDTLMNIAEVFSGLVHARRATRLEWAIIWLIAFEIFLTLWQMYFKLPH
jgi:uncharacterized Rmd1/YagE family protein